MNHEIRQLLTELWRLSLDEHWDESKAQELVMWGGELYEKLLKEEAASVNELKIPKDTKLDL